MNVQVRGWKMYRTTRPLVPENFLGSHKIIRDSVAEEENVRQILTKVK